MAEETLLKRVLPHNLEAEQSVIGSMLMDKEAVAAALDICAADDFYSRQYAAVFECMGELFNEGKPIDLVTVQEKLKEKDVPPEVGSIDFVRSIVENVPTSANIKAYARIVHDKAVKRRLIRVNEEIENSCYADRDEVDVLLQETEEKIFRLLQEELHYLIRLQQFLPHSLLFRRWQQRERSWIREVPDYCSSFSRI